MRFSLIPNPCRSDAEAIRFCHGDLPALSPRELWAERTTIEAELARKITSRVRPRLIWVVPEPVMDTEWLEERSRRLRTEERRRKRGRHAA